MPAAAKVEVNLETNSLKGRKNVVALTREVRCEAGMIGLRGAVVVAEAAETISLKTSTRLRSLRERSRSTSKVSLK